jgi:hypothetical protein
MASLNKPNTQKLCFNGANPNAFSSLRMHPNRKKIPSIPFQRNQQDVTTLLLFTDSVSQKALSRQLRQPWISPLHALPQSNHRSSSTLMNERHINKAMSIHNSLSLIPSNSFFPSSTTHIAHAETEAEASERAAEARRAERG